MGLGILMFKKHLSFFWYMVKFGKLNKAPGKNNFCYSVGVLPALAYSKFSVN